MVLKLSIVFFIFIFIRLLLETLVFFEQNINLNKEEYNYIKIIKSIKYLEFKNLFYETFKPRSKRNYSEYIQKALTKEVENQKVLIREMKMKKALIREVKIQNELKEDVKTKKALIEEFGIQNELIEKFKTQKTMIEEFEIQNELIEDIFKVKTVYNFEKNLNLSFVFNDVELEKPKIIKKNMNKKWTEPFKFKGIGISLKKCMA